MKCYFHFDEKTGKKILIPYCWSVLWSDDIRDCRCESETFSKFENIIKGTGGLKNKIIKWAKTRK